MGNNAGAFSWWRGEKQAIKSVNGISEQNNIN